MFGCVFCKRFSSRAMFSFEFFVKTLALDHVHTHTHTLAHQEEKMNRLTREKKENKLQQERAITNNEKKRNDTETSCSVIYVSYVYTDHNNSSCHRCILETRARMVFRLKACCFSLPKIFRWNSSFAFSMPNLAIVVD